MSKRIIDTNLIIRFLINDDSTKSSQVEKLLKDRKNTNILLDTVIAEIVWVLLSYYELQKESVIEKVQALIHVDSIQCDRRLLDRTLTIWEKYNISFIDAYIAAVAQTEKLSVYSYDEKFDRIKGIIRKEP